MNRSTANWTAFMGARCIAAGSSTDVVRVVKNIADRQGQAMVLVFDDSTGRQVDFDTRGTIDDVLARLTPDASAIDISHEPRKPGRPKLGVVSREVTLLPRHWDWLNEQPGGASGALRRLVDGARAANAGLDQVRLAQSAADRFMTALAGNLKGYEEAARALYSGNRAQFTALTETWPSDIRDHTRRLAEQAFLPTS